MPAYLWDAKDPDLDDPLHNPDPVRDAALDRQFTFFSLRGWANATVLLLIVAGLVTLFIGYPIIVDATKTSSNVAGFNLGGINASGQVRGVYTDSGNNPSPVRRRFRRCQDIEV